MFCEEPISLEALLGSGNDRVQVMNLELLIYKTTVLTFIFQNENVESTTQLSITGLCMPFGEFTVIVF